MRLLLRCLLLKPVLLRALRTPKSLLQPRRRTVATGSTAASPIRPRNARRSSACATSAYLREGAIAPNASQTFSDPYDDSPNARIFGLYLDGELASSIRIHVTSPEHADFPSYHVFEDLLDPELAGRPRDRRLRRASSPTRCSRSSIPACPTRRCGCAGSRREHFRAEHFLVADPYRASGVLPPHLPPSPDLRRAALSAARQADQPDDRERRRRSPSRCTSAIRSSARPSSSGACCSGATCSRRAPRPWFRWTNTARPSGPHPRSNPSRSNRHITRLSSRPSPRSGREPGPMLHNSLSLRDGSRIAASRLPG